MIYGISGASGVGKTTVAQLVADTLEITFIKTSISAVAKKNGFDAVGAMTIEQRVSLQEALLADHIEVISNTERPAILDRTPIDFIAYMLGEVGMHSGDGISSETMFRVSAYVTRCMIAAQNYYDFVFHLAPLPFYEQTDTRPAENPAYQRHCDLIMRGALCDMSGKLSHALLNTTDLAERQEFIHDTIVDRLNYLEEMRAKTPSIN